MHLTFVIVRRHVSKGGGDTTVEEVSPPTFFSLGV